MNQDNDQILVQLIKELQDSYKAGELDEIIIEEMPMDFISENVKKELERFIHLQSIQFNKCALKYLDNLPNIDSIVRIVLDHNELSGKELQKLSIYSKLVAVSIIDNKFESMEDIKQLALNQELAMLNTYKNPVADQPKFRQETYEYLSKLIYLDNLAKSGDEIRLNEKIKISKSVAIIGGRMIDPEKGKIID